MNYVKKYPFVSLTILAILVSLIATTLFLQNNEGASFVEAQSLPPKIDITHVGSTTTIVQWDTIPTATHYYIFICDWDVECIGRWHRPVTKTEKQTSGITNLKPNNDYSIVALAFSGRVWSKYSNWKHIKTRKSGGDIISRRINTPNPDLSICDWRPTQNTRTDPTCYNGGSRQQPQTQYECGPATCTGGTCTKGDTEWQDTGTPTDTACPQGQTCSGQGVCGTTTIQSPACRWTNTGQTRTNESHTCSDTQTRQTERVTQAEQRCGPATCTGGSCNKDATKWIDTSTTTTPTTCPAGQTCTGTACTTTTTTITPGNNACSWQDTTRTRPANSCSNDKTQSISQTEKEQQCGPAGCTGGECTAGQANQWIATGTPTTTTCTGGTTCNNGSCAPQCTQDSDCTGTGERCISNTCEVPPTCRWIERHRDTATACNALINSQQPHLGRTSTNQQKVSQTKTIDCGPANCQGGECTAGDYRLNQEVEGYTQKVVTCAAGTLCTQGFSHRSWNCLPGEECRSVNVCPIKLPEYSYRQTNTYRAVGAAITTCNARTQKYERRYACECSGQHGCYGGCSADKWVVEGAVTKPHSCGAGQECSGNACVDRPIPPGCDLDIYNGITRIGNTDDYDVWGIIVNTTNYDITIDSSTTDNGIKVFREGSPREGRPKYCTIDSKKAGTEGYCVVNSGVQSGKITIDHRGKLYGESKTTKYGIKYILNGEYGGSGGFSYTCNGVSYVGYLRG